MYILKEYSDKRVGYAGEFLPTLKKLHTYIYNQIPRTLKLKWITRFFFLLLSRVNLFISWILLVVNNNLNFFDYSNYNINFQCNFLYLHAEIIP